MKKQDVEGTKVLVCPVRGREAEIGALRDRIVSLGGTLVCEKARTPADCETCIDQADVVVVLLCPESVNDPDVKDLVQAASRAGKRVVFVWLEGCEIGELPPFLKLEGDGVVHQDGDDLKKAIIDGETIWKTPDGTRRPDQKIPRHNC